MLRYARTYGSIHHPKNIAEAWQYPTGPLVDTFGIPIQNSRQTFGLEEFNFNPFFIKEKVAYVPCYGTARYYPRPVINELRLIYKISGRCHIHYASMFDVRPILNEEIIELRQIIDPVMNDIYFNEKPQLFFEDRFTQFTETIGLIQNSNIIASNHNHTPFLVNVRYSNLVVLEKPVVCELTPNNVNQWKIRVDMPGNCTNI